MKLFVLCLGTQMTDFKAQDNKIIEFTGTFIFILYLLIAVIILINLFIAMLSNTYAIVQEDAEKEWKYLNVIINYLFKIFTNTTFEYNIINCFVL